MSPVPPGPFSGWSAGAPLSGSGEGEECTRSRRRSGDHRRVARQLAGRFDAVRPQAERRVGWRKAVQVAVNVVRSAGGGGQGGARQHVVEFARGVRAQVELKHDACHRAAHAADRLHRPGHDHVVCVDIAAAAIKANAPVGEIGLMDDPAGQVGGPVHDHVGHLRRGERVGRGERVCGGVNAGVRARRKGKAKGKRGDNSGTTRGMVVGAHRVLCPTITQSTGATHHRIPKFVPFLPDQFQDPLRHPEGCQ